MFTGPDASRALIRVSWFEGIGSMSKSHPFTEAEKQQPASAINRAPGECRILLALRCVASQQPKTGLPGAAARGPAAQGKGLLLFSRHLFLSAQARPRKRTGLLSARPWRDSGLPLQTNETAERKRMFPGPWVVKMSLFALDFEIEMPYPLAPPQGWEVDFDL